MAIIWAGLAPHPPIIVESVGRERCAECRTTIENMEQLSQDLVAHQPDRLVVISPHSPRPYNGIAGWFGQRLHGSFGQFGAPHTTVELDNDVAWMLRFKEHFQEIAPLDHEPLDHGAMVPLYFAIQAGWQGPTCVIGLPWDDGPELDRIGRALASASDARTAVIASGDMSHCLKAEGPYGFSPRGPEFDNTFVSHVKACAYRDATRIQHELREDARQDVVESCRVAWSAIDYHSENHHFYSYEGPFGVGYTIMKFFGNAA